MDDFEALLLRERTAVERFVRFRLRSSTDADDVLQEIYLTAYQKFPQLKDQAAFKPWLISIARNKCTDYFRQRSASPEIPMDELADVSYASEEADTVRQTMRKLKEKDRQILRLYFWNELSQAEISAYLGIPLGTVKSRLYTAKQNFAHLYPSHTEGRKGAIIMKKLPKYLPEYKIDPSPLPPFAVKWEELMGWFLVPKLGEKLSWAMYDMPSREMGEMDTLEVVGKAEVHGIEGVEIHVRADMPMECNSEGGMPQVHRTFIAQLTDTHCRYLAESHIRDGVKKCYTFLDGDSFLNNWGFGENNCGNEVNLAPKGDIQRNGSVITSVDKPFLLDIVGRYTVTINGKTYDTVCVMDIETYDGGMTFEQFLDKNGRTILCRRFNRDDWAFDRYQKKWSDQLPNNERLMINGIPYVHWYDCVTDYVF